MHIKALSSKSLCMARKRIPALSRVFTWRVASMRLNFNNIMSRILEWVNVVRNARQKLVNIALHAKQQGMLSERERDVKKLLDLFTFFKTAYWLSSPSFIIKWFLSKRQCWCLWKHNISYNESSVKPLPAPSYAKVLCSARLAYLFYSIKSCHRLHHISHQNFRFSFRKADFFS